MRQLLRKLAHMRIGLDRKNHRRYSMINAECDKTTEKISPQ